MPEADVERMRDAVLVTARATPAADARVLPRAFVVTAATLLLLCGGMLTGLQSVTSHLRAGTESGDHSRDGASPDDGTGLAAERQQLQFATPGGTRIIWVFDSQFDVKGTLP
jgi:hypothetical protein